VVEKDDGSHFTVGPVREEAVGRRSKFGWVDRMKRILWTLIRGDVYAERTGSTEPDLSGEEWLSPGDTTAEASDF